jgi:hypothetical protein
LRENIEITGKNHSRKNKTKKSMFFFLMEALNKRLRNFFKQKEDDENKNLQNLLVYRNEGFV